MAIPLYLQQFKAAGVYRVVFDKSTVLNQDTQMIRLVVGYSEKGPFNIPVYVKDTAEFIARFGNISKKLEKRGIFFHRLALQMLKVSPILCLNLKKFAGESVDGATITSAFNPKYDAIETVKLNVEDIYNTTRFWELDAEKLNGLKSVSGMKMDQYINLAVTGVKSQSVTYFIRKASGTNVSSYKITVNDWYSNESDDMPEFLVGHEGDLMSDYMAEIYVFKGEFTPKQVMGSTTLKNYFNVESNDDDQILKLKPYVLDSFGDPRDTLEALYADSTSNALGHYVGSLIPRLKDKQGSYISLDTIFNSDQEVHNMMMSFNEDLLEEGAVTINLAGRDKITQTVPTTGKKGLIYLDDIFAGVATTQLLGNKDASIIADKLHFTINVIDQNGFPTTDFSINVPKDNNVSIGGLYYITSAEIKGDEGKEIVSVNMMPYTGSIVDKNEFEKIFGIQGKFAVMHNNHTYDDNYDFAKKLFNGFTVEAPLEYTKEGYIKILSKFGFNCTLDSDKTIQGLITYNQPYEIVNGEVILNGPSKFISSIRRLELKSALIEEVDHIMPVEKMTVSDNIFDSSHLSDLSKYVIDTQQVTQKITDAGEIIKDSEDPRWNDAKPYSIKSIDKTSVFVENASFESDMAAVIAAAKKSEAYSAATTEIAKKDVIISALQSVAPIKVNSQVTDHDIIISSSFVPSSEDNKSLFGALQYGAIKENAIVKDAIPAQPAIYDFMSYDSAEKTTQYGSGQVEVVEMYDEGALVRVKSNTSTDPNASNFLNHEFKVNTLDTTDPIQLYTTDNTPIDIWVTVSISQSAQDGQDAVYGDIPYTNEEVDAHNSLLSGAKFNIVKYTVSGSYTIHHLDYSDVILTDVDNNAVVSFTDVETETVSTGCNIDEIYNNSVYGSSVSFIKLNANTTINWDYNTECKIKNIVTPAMICTVESDKSLQTILHEGDYLLANDGILDMNKDGVIDKKDKDTFYDVVTVQEMGTEYWRAEDKLPAGVEVGDFKFHYIVFTGEPLVYTPDDNSWIVRIDQALNQEIGTMYPQYLEGYTFINDKPLGTGMYNKYKWHEQILSALTDYKGLRTGLLNKAEIDYRYVVDTFESYPSSNLKSVLSYLCKEKQSAFCISNFPSVQSFVKCPYTSFVDDKGNFNVEYVVAGYNKKKTAAMRFTLPADYDGASFIAFYSPLKFSDGYIDTIVPSAGLVSNLFVEKYMSRQPYYIVAGPNYGAINDSNLVGPDYRYSTEELQVIEPFGVNVMVYRPNFGTFINANQTAKQTPVSALSKVHVRELVIYLQDEIEKVLQSYQWEFNNPRTRNAILDKANTICELVMANGGLQAYKNIMDESNNTPEIIDNEMAILSTHIEPGMGCGKMVQELTLYRTGKMAASLSEA